MAAKKFISEFVGTMLLVIFGCGACVAANTYVTQVAGVALPFTMLLIAFAFGLILMALVYTIGKVSGAHVNPAVSVACLIDGRMSMVECVYYICAQVLGGLVGATVLSLIFGSFTSLGANGYESLSALSTITTMQVALAIEVILTFVFVLVVLCVTKKENCMSGVVIGLTLTLVHIMGIPFTGTSVNPARSIGPALLTKGVALEQLWVFVVAPLAGGILAALFYKFVIADKTEKVVESEETEEVLLVDEEDEEDEVVPEVEEVEEPKKTTKKEKSSKKKGK